MFAHEPVLERYRLHWEIWGPSGIGKSASMRRIWLVKQIPVCRPQAFGQQHYIVLLENFEGVMHSFWTIGSPHIACRPPYYVYGPASGECPFSKGAFPMAAGPKVWTEERVTQRFAEGRGQGVGDNYIPWVWVQEFASNANQTRIPSLHLKRTIHTFSYLERAMHTWHEYAGYVDYREQFPMDRRITRGAALQLGIRHPVYPQSRDDMVMMLDTLVVKDGPDGKRTVEAWDAKPLEKLDDDRINDKLKLHKAFCAYIGIEHSFFTERTLPRDMTETLEWARGGLPLEGELLPYPRFLEVEGERLLQWLRSKHHALTVGELCASWDAPHQFEPGTSLRLFKVLLWTKQVYLRLDQPQPWTAVLPDQRFYIHKEGGHGPLLH